jgi:hypothetical protein
MSLNLNKSQPCNEDLTTRMHAAYMSVLQYNSQGPLCNFLKFKLDGINQVLFAHRSTPVIGSVLFSTYQNLET